MSDWVERGLDLAGFQDDTEIEEGSVVLLFGKDSFGEKVYVYLQLSYEAYLTLLEDVKNQRAGLPSVYGRVLAAGKGSPGFALSLRMKEMYSLNDVSSRRTGT